MYIEVEAEQETCKPIELMEENMVTQEVALTMASCKRSQNKTKSVSITTVMWSLQI
jgi:hypothetical protein